MSRRMLTYRFLKKDLLWVEAVKCQRVKWMMPKQNIFSIVFFILNLLKGYIQTWSAPPSCRWKVGWSFIVDTNVLWSFAAKQALQHPPEVSPEALRSQIELKRQYSGPRSTVFSWGATPTGSASREVVDLERQLHEHFLQNHVSLCLGWISYFPSHLNFAHALDRFTHKNHSVRDQKKNNGSA